MATLRTAEDGTVIRLNNDKPFSHLNRALDSRSTSISSENKELAGGVNGKTFNKN